MMLLLKTIWIFLKNKQKELGIFKGIIAIIQGVTIISLITLGMDLIGIFAIKVFPFIFEGMSIDKYVIILSWNSIGICFVAGLYFIMTAFCVICGIFIVIGLIYILGKFIIFFCKNIKDWIRHFKFFISNNWKKAKLSSGMDKRFLMYWINKKGEYIFIKKCDYSDIMRFEGINYVDTLLKRNFNYYIDVVTYTIEEIKDISLNNNNFKNFLVDNKIKWSKCCTIAVADFIKENKL